MVQLISHVKSANYIDGIGINNKAYLSLQRKTWVPSPHGFLNSPQVSLTMRNQDGGQLNPSALGFILFSLVLFD